MIGAWSVLSVFAQREGICLEPQEDLPHLPSAGTEFANQAEETHCPGEAGDAHGAGIDQSGLHNGFHA